ncbi:hypothetical protein HYALB_00006915 [Hymenoscyphus albidus]|uniref:Uncharacterized protein n=1 Tax=Hymenoscyphus albidus TaxID=595503 RepID=A0A9N9LF16_9HELO|nr:hypothetical protein HYALB_00006915 [Hymenoscyphus albidus]
MVNAEKCAQQVRMRGYLSIDVQYSLQFLSPFTYNASNDNDKPRETTKTENWSGVSYTSPPLSLRFSHINNLNTPKKPQQLVQIVKSGHESTPSVL